MFSVPNQYRIRSGPMASDDGYGNNGMFAIWSILSRPRCPLRVIATDGGGWEHVSASFPDRCPTWEEMCRVKALFWAPEDCVLQFHPPQSEYVNVHPYCLHLWRPIGQTVPTPPKWMVG